MDRKIEMEKLVKKYHRQMVRSAERESRLEERKEDLSVHGHFSLGWFGGRAMLYQDIIDDLEDILKDGNTGRD